MKSKLNIFLQTSQCEKSIKIAHIKIGSLEQKIKELSSVRNVQIVEDYIRNLECDEKFSHCGMWKLRKKLHPSKQMDPPNGKTGQRWKSHNCTTPHQETVSRNLCR